jgi:hypothetical protein
MTNDLEHISFGLLPFAKGSRQHRLSDPRASNAKQVMLL